MESEKFRGAAGRFGGAFTLVLAAVVVAIGLAELDRGFPPWVVAVAALLGVLSWASALRPALRVEQGALVMTNMFETVHIPLVAIEDVGVGLVLSVHAAGRTYVSSTVARSARPIVLGGRGHRAPSEGGTQTMSHADFVEERLRGLAEDARRVAARSNSAQPVAPLDGVRREPAWVPIVVVGLAVLAVLVTVLAG